MDVQAMHIANGIVNGTVSAVFAVFAALVLAFCGWRARADLDDRLAPMAGLVAAFIFAVQMVNFPILPGVSGHLLGGALAAILVGPATGLLCMSVVFLVQALLFADGGITALGTNIDLMGLVTVLVGYGVFRLLQALLPKRLSMVAPAAAVSALVSVPTAALCFVGLYAVGGHADVPLGALTTAMVGWHVVIGIGEAAITGLAVASIVAVRPDLVHGAKRVLAARTLEVRGRGAVPS